MRPAEERYTKLILSCAVYKSGGVFALHELQRSIPHHDGYVSAGRLREVVNSMIDKGQMSAIPAPGGEMHYRACTGARELLGKLWARPVATEHTPRWR